MNEQRRDFLKTTAALAATVGFTPLNEVLAQSQSSIEAQDRVFITNEDSNTLVVINPSTNTVETTINLTSFDEDARPPFRFVTAGVAPTHAAMIHKPLYHGCIDAHGAVPSPDGKLLATSGRGSSNIYLIDAVNKRVLGNVPNPAAGPTTNPERLSSGILVGREPHEPTFTRNGKELWVTLRGEDRIAILDVERALKQVGGTDSGAILRYVPTINGPAQVWFNAQGTLAFVASQKVAKVDVLRVNADAAGHSRPERVTTLDISAQDKPAFTPFLKTTPDGREVWFSHKLADTVSCRSTSGAFDLLDTVSLGAMSRPNHVEFVENAKGKVVMRVLRGSTTAARVKWLPVRSPLSTAVLNPAPAKWWAASLRTRARHMACGLILKIICCTWHMSRTNSRARSMLGKRCAQRLTYLILIIPGSSRKFRWAV